MRCLNRTLRSFLLLRSAVLITRGLPFARAYPLSPRVYRPPAHIIRLQSANDRMLMSAGDAYLVDAVNSVELVQPPTMPKSRSSTPTSTSSADSAPPFDAYAYVAVCAVRAFVRVTASRFRPNRVDWLASSFGRWDPIPSTPCTGLRLPDLEYSEYPLRVRPGAETAARVDASLRRVKPTKVLRQMRCMHASVDASLRSISTRRDTH